MKYKSLVACVGLVFAGSSWGENRHMDDRLVTDALEKASMGFAENDVVYVRENSNKSQSNEQIKGLGGLVHVGYMGVESQGRTGNFTYSTISGSGDIYRTGTEIFSDTLLELPDGYSFDWVRVWGRDTNVDENLRFFVFQTCYPSFSAGAPDSTNLGTITSSGNAGDWSASVSLSDVTVNNTSCTYYVRTAFDDTGSSLRLYKVRAELNPAL